jgi:hypothetical protein
MEEIIYRLLLYTPSQQLRGSHALSKLHSLVTQLLLATLGETAGELVYTPVPDDAEAAGILLQHRRGIERLGAGWIAFKIASIVKAGFREPWVDFAGGLDLQPSISSRR